MSVFSDVCDAWLTDLQSNVTGLDTTTIPSDRTHLYAPWSMESMAALASERHLAIWPEGEPDVVSGYVAGSPPSDLAEQSYVITVWEDASAESSRRFDDDTANKAWLTLYEAIRARLYVSTNQDKGQTNSLTNYKGGTMAMESMTRMLAIRFTKRSVLSFT